MNRFLISTILAFVLAAPASAAAQITTDRPTAGASSTTVGAKTLQVETGFDTTEFEVHTIPTKIRFGVIEPLEIHVESGIVVITEADTFVSDLDVGGKYHITDTGSLSIGVLAAITIPVEGDLVGSKVVALFDAPLGPLSLNMNLGVAIPLNEREFVDDSIFGSAGLGIPVVDNLGAFAEVFTTVPLSDADPSLGFNGGVTYLVQPNMQIDAYFRVANVTESSVFGAGIGFATKF